MPRFADPVRAPSAKKSAARPAAVRPPARRLAPSQQAALSRALQLRARERAAAAPSPETASLDGLPAPLQAGIEGLSGLAMDDVRVHRNSAEPAKLGALAYTQGSDIHLGPGQDQHLPHEAWHVVQQMQGRVRATKQMKGAAINTDVALEKEADRLGRHAESLSRAKPPANSEVRGGNEALGQQVFQLQLGNEKPGKDARDNAKVGGVEDRVRVQIKKWEDAKAKEAAILREIRAFEVFQRSPNKVAPDNTYNPKVTVSAAKPKSTYEKRYDELMDIERKFRKENLNAWDQKYFEQTGQFANQWVANQIYLLNTPSTYGRVFNQDSPVSVWKVLEMISMLYGGGQAPYGVFKDGMTLNLGKIPAAYNRTIFQRGMGPELKLDKLGKAQWNFPTTGKMGFPANTKQWPGGGIPPGSPMKPKDTDR